MKSPKKSALKKMDKGVARLEIQMQPRNYVVTFNQDILGNLLYSSMEVIKTAFDD